MADVFSFPAPAGSPEAALQRLQECFDRFGNDVDAVLCIVRVNGDDTVGHKITIPISSSYTFEDAAAATAIMHTITQSAVVASQGEYGGKKDV